MLKAQFDRAHFDQRLPDRFVAPMPAYRPGQGLNRESLERFRTRKVDNDAVATEDISEQWDKLLGEGAKKVPRCSGCTMPVQDAKVLLCSRCASPPPPPPPPPPPLPPVVDAPSRRGAACHNSRERSQTPSTHACSEDWDDNSSPARLRLECGAEALVGECLEGEWMGDAGETYWVKARGAAEWACSFKYGAAPQQISLFHDKVRGVIWWGDRGDYFVNVVDICAGQDQITWSSSGQLRGPRTKFAWCRTDLAMPQNGDNQTNKGMEIFAEAEHADSMTANAVQEVLEQLESPGSNGFVWVARWNERYLQHLGTLREFLDSHPEEFIVIPQRGKSFRVAMTKKVNGRPNWQ